MVWYGMVLDGTVRDGTICIVLHCIELHCVVLCCMVWYCMVGMYVCMYVYIIRIHIYTIHVHDLVDVSAAAFRSYGFEHTLTLENMEGRGLWGHQHGGGVRCSVIWLHMGMGQHLLFPYDCVLGQAWLDTLVLEYFAINCNWLVVGNTFEVPGRELDNYET
jgi:hypothetical protein